MRVSRSLSLAMAGLLFAFPVAALAADPAPATAASSAPTPLAAGGAAGVKEAQGFGFDDVPWVFIAGGGLVLAGVLIALGRGDSTSSTGTQ